jgi:hypothetical protein
MEFVFLMVAATSLWVLVDANSIGVKSGSLKGGFFDMGPAGWFFSCILLWIVAFPVYLAKRSEYKRLQAEPEPLVAPASGVNATDVMTQRLADSITQLERLAQLRDKGIISEDEFQTTKRALLSPPSGSDR